MLTFTEDAIGFIRRLTTGPGRSADAGVRIATGSMAGSLTTRVTDVPNDGDQVINTSGARVYLEPAAAQILEDKTLDASIVDGSLTFIVANR